MSLSRREMLKLLAGASASVFFAGTSQAATPRNSIYCPIVMYHYISAAPADANATLRDLTVPPDKFAPHLDALKQAGFNTVTMQELYSAWQGEIDLPSKPLVLSFDDGYWDAYAHATPLLLERGMRGTFYLVSNFMEQGGYLTWGQAAEMRNAGMEIGNHSASHPDLSLQSREQQRAEIEQSTFAIEQTLGFRPVTFCYPFGRQNRLTRLLLQEFGYQTAVTTADGTIAYRANPYQMRRVRVRNSTTPEVLLWMVNRQV